MQKGQFEPPHPEKGKVTEPAATPSDASVLSIPSLVLLDKMQHGETEARDELIRRYWPRLERWARGRVPAGARDLYDTGDLVQETMLTAFDKLDGFAPEHDGALFAYLRTAVLNRVRSMARTARRRGDKVELGERDVADQAPSPLEAAIGRDTVDRYERAMARLRPEDRDAIHMKIELDLPYDQIREALGKKTLTAARMSVSRALVRLAREMHHHAG
jgi:RNA polymerase sigma-70 factor (ECF subfamily)